MVAVVAAEARNAVLGADEKGRRRSRRNYFVKTGKALSRDAQCQQEQCANKRVNHGVLLLQERE